MVDATIGIKKSDRVGSFLSGTVKVTVVMDGEGMLKWRNKNLNSNSLNKKKRPVSTTPQGRSIWSRWHPSHAIHAFREPYGLFQLPILKIQDLYGAALGTTHIGMCAVRRQN